MDKKKTVLKAFNSIRLCDNPIKTIKGIKKNKKLSLIKNIAKEPYYTFYEDDKKKQIDIVSYSEKEVKSTLEKDNYILPVNEICRTHYIDNNQTGIIMYVLFSYECYLLIQDGYVTHYAKVKNDLESFSRGAKELALITEKNTSESVEFVLDEMKESFSGSIILLDNEKLYKNTPINRFIKNPNYKKTFFVVSFFRKIKTNFLLILGFFMFLSLVMGGNAFLFEKIKNTEKTLLDMMILVDNKSQPLNKSLDKVNDDLEKIGKNYNSSIIGNLSSIQELTKRNSRLLNDIINNSNKFPEEQSNSELNKKLDSIFSDYKEIKLMLSKLSNNDFNTLDAESERKNKKSDLRGNEGFDTSENRGDIGFTKGMEDKLDSIEDFMCFPLIIQKESITCLYEGDTVKIGTDFTFLKDFKVRYLPNLKSFEKVQDGITKNIALSKAKRGF